MPLSVGGVNPDQYIYVPSKFQVKPGAKIRNDLFVGPGLGVGLQVTQPLLGACQFAQQRQECARGRRELRNALHHSVTGIEVLCKAVRTTSVLLSGLGLCCLQGGVFLLQDAQGRPDPDKVLKATFKLSLGGIAGMTHMEREWAVGRRLAPLEKLDKALPGFMATGAAVLTRAGSFRGMLQPTALIHATCMPHATNGHAPTLS